jgi:hypothetical protein
MELGFNGQTRLSRQTKRQGPGLFQPAGSARCVCRRNGHLGLVFRFLAGEQAGADGPGAAVGDGPRTQGLRAPLP